MAELVSDCQNNKQYDYKSLRTSDNIKTYNVGHAIEHFGFGKFQIKILLVVGLSWFVTSFQLTLLAVLGPALKCSWRLNNSEEAFLSTCFFIGMMFGCLFWGWLCDIYGRKKGVIVSLTWVMTSQLLAALSASYKWMLASMALIGFGIGGEAQSVTIFTELVPTRFRATGVLSLQVFFVLGNIIAGIIGSFMIPHYGWRWFIIVATIPITLFLTFSWCLPESPRYLLAAGKEEDAMCVMRKIAWDNKKELPPGILDTAVSKDAGSRGYILELLSKEHRRTTLLLWIMWFTSVFSYYGTILFTTPLLRRGKNICLAQAKGNNFSETMEKNYCEEATTHDYIDLVYTISGELPGLVFTWILVESIGRKLGIAIEFLISSCAMAALHFCIKRIFLISLVFILRALLSGITSAAYLYTPEVYPTSIRGIGIGVASSMARIGAIVTPFVAEVLLVESLHVAVGIYSSLMFLCVIAVLLLPKETKGKALETSSDSVNPD